MFEARAGEYGEMVAGFINEAYRIPYSFAGILESTAEELPLKRDRLELAVAAVLKKTRKFHQCMLSLTLTVTMA